LFLDFFFCYPLSHPTHLLKILSGRPFLFVCVSAVLFSYCVGRRDPSTFCRHELISLIQAGTGRLYACSFDQKWRVLVTLPGTGRIPIGASCCMR
jgi:hypothetical protein